MNNLIQIIAIDLDGTLLQSDGTVSDKNRQAIRQAQEQGILVILATGKSRASAEYLLSSLNLTSYGVFSQGLVITNPDGTIFQEILLDPEVTEAVAQYTAERNFPLMGYARFELVSAEQSPYWQLLVDKFQEPLARQIPQLSAHPINKLMLSDETTNDQTRTELEILVGNRAFVTQSVPEFIEILPPHQSKGNGVKTLLQHLNIPPEHLLAIGDGENDVEMFQLAGVSIAVENAHPTLKAVADKIVCHHDEGGVAEAIQQFALQQIN